MAIDRNALTKPRIRRNWQKLTTNGGGLLPTQTGKSGKWLTTNGVAASWSPLSTVAISGLASDLNLTGFTLSSGHVTGLATVATTGAYSDLTGRPTLATVATTGAYGDLSGRPTLATVATTGAYGDLTGRPTLATVATTGAYSDLTGKPSLATVATTGAYGDLTGRPTLATVATSGAYADLTGTPTLTTLKWVDLTDSNSIVGQTGVEVDFNRQVTLPANTIKNNSILKIRFSGIYTNTGAPAITFKLYLGSVVLLNTAALAASLTNSAATGWTVEVTVYCVAAGATATVRILGAVTYHKIFPYLFPSGDITVDTTASSLVKLSATWPATTTSDTIKVQQAFVEVVYT